MGREQPEPFFCGVGADTISVPTGATLADYIKWVSPGDILSLAAGGSYTLGAAENGFSTLQSGTAARHTIVRGNGATITGGASGINLNAKAYIDFENLNLREQTDSCVIYDGCDFITHSNCTYGSNANAAMVDILKIFRSDDLTFSDCGVTASSGGNTLDGFEFWGPCNRIRVTRCTVAGLSGGGTPDHHGFEVYAGDADDFCDDIIFEACSAANCEVGYSCEGGPNAIAHTNIKATNSTATGCDFDAQGIQGSTLYVTAGTLTNRNGTVTEL